MKKTLGGGFRPAVGMLAFAAMTCYGFDWPSSGIVTVPAGTVAEIATEAQVAAVEGLSGIVLEGADSVVEYSCGTKSLTLSASVSGAGVFKATSGMLMKLTGDNSALTGCFEFKDTPVEVRHRYGLGCSSTAAAKYDRGNNGSLDFYGDDGTCRNDVALELVSSVKNEVLPVQGKSSDKLIQNADVTYRSWQGVSFGNCDIISGKITFSARAVSALSGCTLSIGGTASLVNAVEWSNYGGTGTLRLDSVGNAYTAFKLSPWAGRVICGVDGVFGPTVPVIMGTGKNDDVIYCLDIGATAQQVAYIRNENPVAAGAEPYSVVCGTGSLTFCGAGDVSAAVKFRGGMSLTYSGTGTYTLVNQLSDSSGKLTVSSGSVVLDAGAGWSGAVTVDGGTLDCRSVRSMSSGTKRLEVPEGLLVLGAGVELKVASAKIGTAELATGRTYSVAELNAAAGSELVSGAGAVTVVEYEEPDPEGPFEWPDEEGATAIIRENETVFVYDADVAKVAKLGLVKMRAGSMLVISNLTQELTLKADVTGPGRIVAKDSAKLVLTGDNRGLSGGYFEFLGSVVEVRSRYGLGGPETGVCRFDRMTRGTLDFYSPTGVITNDVMIDVFTSVLTSQNVELHTLSGDTLVQTGGIRFNGYQALILGNVTMTDGTLSSAGARQYGAAAGRAVHIGGASRITGVDMGITGEGRMYLDVGGHEPVVWKTSKWGGHIVFGSDGVPGSSVVLSLGDSAVLGHGDVDLNGCDATVKYIDNNPVDAITQGADAYSIVKSETPAELTMAVPADSDVTGAVKFEGAVDVSFEGEGAYTLINACSTSTGTLSVCSGSLTLAYKAGWSGTKMNVSGGSVVFESVESLVGAKTRLEVTGGSLSVAAGVELELASARFASAELPEGTYTASEVNELAGSAFMSGAGTVRVGVVDEHFAWPDAPGGSVVVPSGTIGYLEEADVAKVANAAKITIRNDATLYIRNGDTPVSVTAAVSGSGSIVIDGSAGITFAGDNSAYIGHTQVTNSKVAVRHRYGLGSSQTPEAVFVCTWGNGYTLDFYGSGLTNDVPLLLSAYHVQTLNPDVLVQQNGIRRANAWASPTFGNVQVTAGALAGASSIFKIKVLEDAAFTVCGSAYINTWTWNLGVEGNGRFVLGETAGTHRYGTFIVSKGATLQCAADGALQTPSENGVVLEVSDDPVVGLDLGGHPQSLPGLLADPDGVKYARVASDTPAALTVSQASARTLAVSFEGAAGLSMTGAGTVTLAKRVSPTTGMLTVASGSVVLSDGGGWLGDVNVPGGSLTVEATAAVKPFGSKRACRTALTVSGTGTVDLADGVEVCVNALSVGGIAYGENGYYGSAAAAAAGRVPAGNVLSGFTGSGVVRMVGQRMGTAIIVR